MFSRKEAAEFLQRALAVPLKKAIAENSDKGFEIDPARVDNPSNLDANLKNVEALLQIVFDSIIDGADAILSGMRVILFNISKYVNMRFPGKGNMAVGALLILRLVTPAILTPDLYDLVKSPITNRNLKRGLLIVGKIIQNLANGVKFGSKESHMISFNTFLDKNKERYENFILSLITLDESANAQFNHKTTENSAFLSGARVHHVINKKLGELEKLPQSENFRVVDFIAPAELDVFDPSTVGQVINISIGGKWTSMFEKLSGALKNCGPAPDVEKCVKRMAEQSKSPEKKENILVSTKTRATSPGTAAPIQNLKDSRAIYISLKNVLPF